METRKFRQFASRLFAFALFCLIALSFTVSAAASSWEDCVDTTRLNASEDSADDDDGKVKMLSNLERYLRGAYYLEARVNTLKEYNTFDPKDGYFVFSNGTTVPKSICNQLNLADRQAICQLSTYQAFQYLFQTKTYQEETEFRAQVDDMYQTFMDSMPGYVRESLIGFVPSEILAQLDPDQLCTMGDLIVNTEAYQNLKAALEPLIHRPIFAPVTASITEIYTDEQISQMYDKLMQATLKIWPNGSPELHLNLGRTPDGVPTLVCTPTESKGA